jgi:hypothetical protein
MAFHGDYTPGTMFLNKPVPIVAERAVMRKLRRSEGVRINFFHRLAADYADGASLHERQQQCECHRCKQYGVMERKLGQQ